jgi:alpha-ribazole phosphatase
MPTDPVPVTTIDLLRHGEPVGGLRFRGHTDDPLSERGWQQMRASLRTPADTPAPWSVLICSPLRRCADFARQYGRQLGLSVQSEPRLQEIHFGQWEGLSIEAIEAGDAQALHRFWHDPLANTPPGGEALADFRTRVLAAWQALLQQHRGEHLLVVSHGGVMRVLLQPILAMPVEALLRIQVDYACLSRIVVHHHATPQAQLVFHGGGL